MPRVGFEPTVTVFERAKTFHVLDRVATATGQPLQFHTQVILKFVIKLPYF
jgi:hypothetical protein